MNNIKIILAICCSLSAIRYSFAAADPLRAVSDYVFDGDTFAALVRLENDAEVSVRVRIRNIDAPEIHGECDSEIELALKARRRMEELIPKGTRVKLSEIKDDKYLGRIDALVALPDGRDAGRVMMSEKLARAYGGGKRAPWCEENKGVKK